MAKPWFLLLLLFIFLPFDDILKKIYDKIKQKDNHIYKISKQRQIEEWQTWV